MVHHLGHIVPIDGLVDVAVEVFTQRSLIQDTMLIQHVSVDFVPGALCALYVLICIERPGQECAEMGVGDAVAGLEGAVGITVGNAFVDCLGNLRVCPEGTGNICEIIGSIDSDGCRPHHAEESCDNQNDRQKCCHNALNLITEQILKEFHYKYLLLKNLIG